MNSTGTPPIVQKNRSTPGTPVSNRRHVVRRTPSPSHERREVLGEERQPGESLGDDVTQLRRHVEHLDESGVAGAEHGQIRAVAWRPTERLLEHLPGTRSWNWICMPTTSVKNAISVCAEWLLMTT